MAKKTIKLIPNSNYEFASQRNASKDVREYNNSNYFFLPKLKILGRRCYRSFWWTKMSPTDAAVFQLNRIVWDADEFMDKIHNLNELILWHILESNSYRNVIPIDSSRTETPNIVINKQNDTLDLWFSISNNICYI